MVNAWRSLNTFGSLHHTMPVAQTQALHVYPQGNSPAHLTAVLVWEAPFEPLLNTELISSTLFNLPIIPSHISSFPL